MRVFRFIDDIRESLSTLVIFVAIGMATVGLVVGLAWRLMVDFDDFIERHL
jgi:hypothetical protein